MPFLLVTAGATGSGKSKLPDEVFSRVSGKRIRYLSFLVDDLVENDTGYKQEVDAIIEKYQCVPPFSNRTCDLKRPSDELLEAFRNAYFKIRERPGCNENLQQLNCNALNDMRIIRAIQEHKNIVIETTGSFIPTWVLDLTENYTIVFAYAIVAFPTLLERNTSRATKSMTSYMQNRKEEPAPRVIDVRPLVFGSFVRTILKTLLLLRNTCLETPVVSSICFSPEGKEVRSALSNLLIFDNTSSSMQLIYDHSLQANMSAVAFEHLITKAFFES